MIAIRRNSWTNGNLRGFYVILTVGIVGFSLLTYLPAEVTINGVTGQSALWGMAAFICFVMVTSIFLLKTLVDALRKKRKK